MTRRNLYGVTLVILWTMCLFSQDSATRTARELFYEGSSQKPKDPKPKLDKPKNKKTPDNGATTGAEIDDRPKATPPADDSRPLALKYVVRQRDASGEYSEVSRDSVFRSGDGIRVEVQGNDTGYLYIVNRGSSGAWTLLFPSSEIGNGNNHIDAYTNYEVPGISEFTFVDQPGEEHVFIVLSRQPEKDLDRLFHLLRSQESVPAEDNPSKTLIGQSPSEGDRVINTIRNLTSRDLIFSEPQGKREKAAYVANRVGGMSSRVIVDLKLNHR